MSAFRTLTAALTAGLLLAPAGRADDKPNADGFLQAWLVLLPIPLADGDEPADANKKEQVKGEADLAPKEGDKAKAGDRELAWKKLTTNESVFDLKAAAGTDDTDRKVGYAVTYVVAAAERTGLKLKVGSDDQCRVWLNGKLLLTADDERPTEADQNTIDNVTLKKGANVLVMKVVNAAGEWSGCARFTDKDDKPVTDLKVQLKP